MIPIAADLETFGRKLAAAQGHQGDDVDFIAYGSAAQQALRRRGGVVPPLHAFVFQSSAPFGQGVNDHLCVVCGSSIAPVGAVTAGDAASPPPAGPPVVSQPFWATSGIQPAAGTRGLQSVEPVATSLELGGGRRGAWPGTTTASRDRSYGWRHDESTTLERGALAARSPRQVVEAVRAKALTPEEARLWFGVAPKRRRSMFSFAWGLRVLSGTVWRIGLFGAGLALGASGFTPTLTQLAALAVVVVGPGMLWKPWRAVWRWSAASAMVAYVLAPTTLFADGVAVVLASAPAAAVLAARRWRLNG